MNRTSVLLCSLVTLLISFTSHSLANERPSPDNVRRFVTVMAEVKHNYIKPVDDNTLFSNAMKGMVSRLDPHSAYLDANDLKQLRSATSGRFAGIGIEMVPMNGVIKVISPLDGSPAAKANIQPGDFIIRINNHMVDGMSLQEIVKKIRGPKGSKVKLTIMRQGQAPFQITLTRETIKIRNIKAKLYDKKIAYVRISQFQENTKKQLINALRRLQNKHEQSIQALIIDLRNNPGGLLHSAVDISDAFLDSRTLGRNQLIVYAKGRDNQISLQSKAHPGDWMAGKPIIIIINGGSASASEVVAGALQDHRRAIILGTKSFGKGSVQTVIPINRDSAIKLTTHLYYTPMGKQIQAKGIKPNVVVHDAQLTHSKQKSKIDPVHESQLRGHLEQSQHNNRTHSTELNDVNSKLARKDYQLYQALNLAKGLVVSQHRKQPQRA